MTPITFAMIAASTNRLAFVEGEIGTALDLVKRYRSRGADLELGSGNHTVSALKEFESLASDGIMCFRSPLQLQTVILFAKCDGGRIFGWQRYNYPCFVGDPDTDQWVAGTIFRSWLVATTSIGNIYRGSGIRV